MTEPTPAQLVEWELWLEAMGSKDFIDRSGEALQQLARLDAQTQQWFSLSQAQQNAYSQTYGYDAVLREALGCGGLGSLIGRR
jgi:hypothetical protein